MRISRFSTGLTVACRHETLSGASVHTSYLTQPYHRDSVHMLPHSKGKVLLLQANAARDEPHVLKLSISTRSCALRALAFPLHATVGFKSYINCLCRSLVLRPGQQLFKDFQCRCGIFDTEAFAESLVLDGNHDTQVPVSTQGTPLPVGGPPNLSKALGPRVVGVGFRIGDCRENVAKQGWCLFWLIKGLELRDFCSFGRRIPRQSLTP